MISATQSNHPLGQVPNQEEGASLLDIARAQLRAAQMRVTKPRIAIIETLLDERRPTTIEQIHRKLDQKSCDLVTVYRCLAAFESIGLVRRNFLHNGTSLYEITLGAARHYHIVCKDCGQAEKVDYFSVEGMERMLQERGYTDVSHIVEFFGVCPACQGRHVRKPVVVPERSHVNATN